MGPPTPTTTLKQIRGFACSVKGELPGRSTFARLRLERYDAAASLAIGPIVEWAKAVWDKLVTEEELQVVWRRAHSRIAGKAQPFRNVCGPGGAMLASCMSGPPDLEPLSEFLATKKVRGSQAAASLKSLGEGGWWTQSRLFAEGRADDQWCKACGDRGGALGPAEGTVCHRSCACDATKALRESYKDQATLAKACTALHGSKPLFQHGVPLLKDLTPTPVHEVRSCGARPIPDDFVATGHAFTDGALKGRAPSAARRAGWAWVVVDQCGKIVFGLYGPCPDPFPLPFVLSYGQSVSC